MLVESETSAIMSAGSILVVDEFFGGVDAAIDLLGVHAGEIEEQEHEAAIAGIDLYGVGGVEEAAVRRIACLAGDGGFGCACGG